MLNAARRFKRLWTLLVGALGVLWFPKDLQDTPDALRPWRRGFAMVDRETALWILLAIMAIVVAWSDGRGFVRDRKARRAQVDLEEFRRSRTRFTIKEAASLAVGVHPKDYAISPAAQSEAKEMVFYAQQALIRPAEMSDRQQSLLRMGMPHGFDLPAVNEDSYITGKELEGYINSGSKSWLPILDEINRNRHG